MLNFVVAVFRDWYDTISCPVDIFQAFNDKKIPDETSTQNTIIATIATKRLNRRLSDWYLDLLSSICLVALDCHFRDFIIKKQMSL